MKKTAIVALLALAASVAAKADTYTFLVTKPAYDTAQAAAFSHSDKADRGPFTLNTKTSAYARTTNGISRYPGGMITIFK